MEKGSGPKKWTQEEEYSALFLIQLWTLQDTRNKWIIRKGMKMNCQMVICLYLNGYLMTNEFENYFYNNMELFQNELPDLVYEELLCTNFSSKIESISLVTFLKQYILSNNPTLYNMISDAYIERFIEKNNGEIVDILKKRYQPKKSIRIDCKKINTEKEFIRQFRKELNLSTLSGLNWMAMNDLYYDIIYPERLEFINWNDFEERMPQCAVQLKKFLSKVDKHNCVITGIQLSSV